MHVAKNWVMRLPGNANLLIGVPGFQPIVSSSWMFRQVIQLQRIFSQDHARNFVCTEEGDLPVLKHAGQGNSQRLSRGLKSLPADLFPIVRPASRIKIGSEQYFFRIPLD